MKRILSIIAATLIAVAGFMFSMGMNEGESHDDHDGHGHEEEQVDFDNIALTKKQINTVGIRTGRMSQRQLDATLHVNGQLILRPQSQGNVAPLMGGIVKAILVKEGQTVSKGQTMATIENADVVALQREYFSAIKEAEMAHTELTRQKTLQQSGAGVKKTLQQTEKDWRIAQASATGLAHQLQQIGINTAAVAKGHFTTVFPLRAPIAGTVCQLTASIGSYADMQTPLMSIRDNRAVEADVNIFEKDLPKVKPGDRVLLTLTNQPDTKLTGRIYAINKYFNEGTKATSAHVRLDGNGNDKIFDGMYVEGRIVTGSQLCLALPSDAIVHVDGKNYVFMLNTKQKGEHYSFSRHEVSTGSVQNGYTEVVPCEHMNKNSKIVTDNAFYLASMTSEHGEHNH